MKIKKIRLFKKSFITKCLNRKNGRYYNKEMDFEMLNYLLDNVKNWYEFPDGEKQL